jgi:hypothetical protein
MTDDPARTRVPTFCHSERLLYPLKWTRPKAHAPLPLDRVYFVNRGSAKWISTHSPANWTVSAKSNPRKSSARTTKKLVLRGAGWVYNG